MVQRVLFLLGVFALLTLPQEADAQGRGRMGRGPDNAPAEGAKAPDFELRVLGKDGKTDPKKKVRLSKLAKKRPVALIFGSYT